MDSIQWKWRYNFYPVRFFLKTDRIFACVGQRQRIHEGSCREDEAEQDNDGEAHYRCPHF
jgi:hypothetical protein